MRIILLSTFNPVKSTQGQKLAEFYTSSYYNWQHFSDNEVVKVARDTIEKPTWIIDGFPRNIAQAQSILEFDFVLYFKISQSQTEDLASLLKHYGQLNRLTTLNGELDAETLYRETLDAILPF